MSEIIECMSCGVEILPRQDGKCPSCNKDPCQLSSDGQIPLNIYERDRGKMPCVCMICGEETNEVTDFKRSQPEKGQVPLWALFILNPLRWLISYEKNRSEVTVTLPIHKDCFSKACLKPEKIHFDLGYMRFRVSPKLKAAYDQISCEIQAN